MRPFIEPMREFLTLNSQLTVRVGDLVRDLKPTEKDVKIPADTDFASDQKCKDTLFVLTDGYLTYRRSDRRIFTYEPGDIIGIERMFRPMSGVEISSSFPVTVNVYQAPAFFAFLAENPRRLDVWSEVLILKLELYSSIIATLSESKMRNIYSSERIFHEGETIVREGETGSEVLSLIKGRAAVSVGGIQVGEVKEDEVFGVLASLGGIPRTATVTAVTKCHVLVVDKADFSDLMKVKPAAFEKVMQDMARAITDLNAQVAGDSPANAYKKVLGS